MPSVQIYKSRDHQYVRIVESFRDPVTKKPKVKTLENLGRLDKLEAENPNIITELKEKYDANRQKEKQEQIDYSLQFIQSILDTSTHSQQGVPLKNYGYLIYQRLWKQLKLPYFFNYRQKKESKMTFPTQTVAELLTYMRLLEPCSKKRAFERRDKFFQFTTNEVELQDVYRSLSFFASQKEALEAHLNRQLGQLIDRDLFVCFYDVTTYYFESQWADEFKSFGFSKDNKVNRVQVVMGLLIDSHGIPITYELFPGNTNEFGTLEPVLLRLKKDYGIKKIIITADRGLNSKANLARIRQLGFDYVMAYKIRTASKMVKEKVLDQSDYVSVSSDLRMKETTLNQSVKLDGKLYAFQDRFLLTYSKKRAHKDRKDRMRLIEKAIKLSESKSGMKSELKKGGKKYVQLELDGVDLGVDTKKIADDEQYDGYYGIVSSDPTLTSRELVDVYQGLWKIEESFRVMKTNLEARPMFAWSPESIQGHFVLCYLALVIQRLLEHQLKTNGLSLSTERIQTALNSATVSLIEQTQGTDYYLKQQANDDFEAIMKVLTIQSIPAMGRVTQVKL